MAYGVAPSWCGFAVPFLRHLRGSENGWICCCHHDDRGVHYDGCGAHHDGRGVRYDVNLYAHHDGRGAHHGGRGMRYDVRRGVHHAS